VSAAAPPEGSESALPASPKGRIGTPQGELSVGDIVAERDFHLTRDSLVRYAGASGDFNPIHYRDDVATSVGLPGVLAHGMLTMGLAAQPVIDWVGDPGRVIDYQVRFTRPVLVDATDGARVRVVAKVGAVTAPAEPDAADSDAAGAHGEARIDLTVTFDDETVLGKAQLRIRL
jgi:acyl dehydratase